MRHLLKNNLLAIPGVIKFAIVSFLCRKFIGRTSGSCCIQSNRYKMTLFGPLMGGLVCGMFHPRPKQQTGKKIRAGIIVLGIIMSLYLRAQETGKLFFTTSFGLINPHGKFGDAIQSTLAFNSGVEMALKKNWFAQAVFDYNALKYDQQIRDNNSPFLFQNTNSSLLLLGLNGGKNIPFKNPKWFVSVYGGGGYLNIGEPRVTIHLASNIARQEVARESNVFARTGSRLAHKTKSNFFQTIYFDAFYWASPAKVQGGRVNGFSFYVGTRFGTVQ